MNDQIRTLTLKCPSCGAALEVSPDMEHFSCGYCGIEQIVQRRGGTVSLKLIAESISRVQVGTDRTAAELALVRLKHELTATDAKLSEINQRIDQPFDSMPPEYQNNTSIYLAAFVCVLIIFSLVVGVFLFEDKRYVSFVVLILFWAAFGIPVRSYFSKAYATSESAFSSHVAKLKLERGQIQGERERILADIAANKSVVQQPK